MATAVDEAIFRLKAPRHDPDHAVCVELLKREAGSLVVPTLVLAEASYLVRRSLV